MKRLIANRFLKGWGVLMSIIGALLVDVAVLVALFPPWGQQLVHAF